MHPSNVKVVFPPTHQVLNYTPRDSHRPLHLRRPEAPHFQQNYAPARGHLSPRNHLHPVIPAFPIETLYRIYLFLRVRPLGRHQPFDLVEVSGNSSICERALRSFYKETAPTASLHFRLHMDVAFRKANERSPRSNQSGRFCSVLPSFRPHGVNFVVGAIFRFGRGVFCSRRLFAGILMIAIKQFGG